VTKRLVALRRAAIAAIADRMQPTDVGQLREGLAAFSAAAIDRERDEHGTG
jgi:hypothetical protein